MIFSLLELSLEYAPLTVVGLAEYKATFVKDIVFVGRVAIDIAKVQYYLINNYHKGAEPPTQFVFSIISLQWLVWIILEGIFPQSFRF